MSIYQELLLSVMVATFAVTVVKLIWSALAACGRWLGSRTRRVLGAK
jgi:hypothetical protein